MNNDELPTIIWGIENGIRYQDLNNIYFDEAIKFLKEEYIPRNIIFRSCKMHKTEEMMDEYLQTIKFVLKSQCSIIAVDINANKVIGIVVMLPMLKSFSWKLLCLKEYSHPEVDNYFKLIHKLLKSSALYDELAELSMHYFCMGVAIDYSGKSLKSQMLKYAGMVTQSLGISIATFLCESSNDQARARRNGMFMVNEIFYSKCCKYRSSRKIAEIEQIYNSK